MTKSRTYRFGKSQLSLEFGDITTSEAQVLVSSDDYYLSMGGGVSAAIREAGGNAIVLDAAKKVPATLGDVVVTTAGTLPAQYIFHAITIGLQDKKVASEEVIKQTTHRCMRLLDAMGLHSIAFPAIGTGLAGFSYEDVAIQMAQVISKDLLDCQESLEVTIYLFDRFGQMQPIDFVRFFEEFAVRAPNIANHETETPKPSKENKILTSDVLSVTPEEAKLLRVLNLRKLMLPLENQRYKILEQLIDLLRADNEDAIKKTREKLHENDELRLKYLDELDSLSKEEGSPLTVDQAQKSRTVFVSSTYQDLAEHRAAVMDRITRRDMHFRGMERFGADPNRLAPAAKIIEEVQASDVYLGIFGMRYGSIDQATGFSMTELEFNEAKTREKQMLLYVIHDDASIKASNVESDPEGTAKLNDLKARILQNYTVYRFTTIEDLARQVYEDLGKL